MCTEKTDKRFEEWLKHISLWIRDGVNISNTLMDVPKSETNADEVVLDLVADLPGETLDYNKSVLLIKNAVKLIHDRVATASK